MPAPCSSAKWRLFRYKVEHAAFDHMIVPPFMTRFSL